VYITNYINQTELQNTHLEAAVFCGNSYAHTQI